MSRTLRIAILAVGMIVVILAMVATYARDLKGGTEITLKTEPVDPRSLFLGHYATLTYAITRLDSRLLGDHCYGRNAPIFVTLEPDEAGEWRAVRAAPAMPADGFGEARVTLRGRVQWGSECPAESDAQAGKIDAEPVAQPTEPVAAPPSDAEAQATDEMADAADDFTEPPSEEPAPEPEPVFLPQTWVSYGVEQYFASPDAAKKLEELARRRPAGEDGEPPPAPLEIVLSVPRHGRALIKGVVIEGVKTYDQTIW